MLELAVLGFGSNLGRRFLNVRDAVKLISQSPNFNLLGISPVYETQPWGFRRQRDFMNCVAAGLYRSDVSCLFYEIKSIEKKLGRQKTEKWHPRIIDIDVLFFGRAVIRRKDITVPHPLIPYRNFVLKPLANLIPGFKHPVLKKTVQYLFEHSKDNSALRLYKAALI